MDFETPGECLLGEFSFDLAIFGNLTF